MHFFYVYILESITGVRKSTNLNCAKAVAFFALILISARSMRADTEMPAPPGVKVELTTLVMFNGKNGAFPNCGPVQGDDGALYGTAAAGGVNFNAKLPIINGDGTVYEITKIGRFKNLFYFRGTNGSFPDTTLVPDSHGNFYGTTQFGGLGRYPGNGTIFRINKHGIVTTVHLFDDKIYRPDGDLLFGNDGNLYGTTGDGNDGTIFRMTPGGELTYLAYFNGTNGCTPLRSLVQAKDGTLYGITQNGGAYGKGTVFKLTTDGKLTALISFNGTNGEMPSSLLRAADSNLYGVTSQGGTNWNGGTFFKITDDGKFTVLFQFGQDVSDPLVLIQGCDGYLYGAAANGTAMPDADTGYGNIFRMTTNGILKVLFSFAETNGAVPFGLMQAKDGNFYGTTSIRGEYNEGTVFRLHVFHSD